MSFSGELDLFQTQKFIANNIYTDYQVIESTKSFKKIYFNVLFLFKVSTAESKQCGFGEFTAAEYIGNIFSKTV